MGGDWVLGDFVLVSLTDEMSYFKYIPTMYSQSHGFIYNCKELSVIEIYIWGYSI